MTFEAEAHRKFFSMINIPTELNDIFDVSLWLIQDAIFLFVKWWWIVLPDIILFITKQQIYMAYLRHVLQDNKFHLMKIKSFIDLGCDSMINIVITKYQCSWDQQGANLGPVGPRLAPCWPHEPCYQGLVCWRHLSEKILTCHQRPYDVTRWRHRTRSTSFQVMVCWQTILSRHLDQH